MCGSTQAQKHGAKIKFINWLFVMSVREILLEAITWSFDDFIRFVQHYTQMVFGEQTYICQSSE